jgi:hypothetical protein
MSANKGKPSGKYAEKKTDPGRKADYKRTGWPEEANTQRVGSGAGQQQGKRIYEEEHTHGVERGRNRKAGSPI